MSNAELNELKQKSVAAGAASPATAFADRAVVVNSTQVRIALQRLCARACEQYQRGGTGMGATRKSLFL